MSNAVAPDTDKMYVSSISETWVSAKKHFFKNITTWKIFF